MQSIASGWMRGEDAAMGSRFRGNNGSALQQAGFSIAKVLMC
jgi:hypothetical protein